MKNQFAGNRPARGTTLFRWPVAVLCEVTVIAREVYAGLKRLNRGGDYREARISGSRRQQAQVFKAALVERYREHQRCC